MKDQNISLEIEKYKKDGANILIPTTHITGLSQWHKPVFDSVQLNPDPGAGDVYYDNQSKKYRLSKQAIMKLAVTAGVMWHPTETRRIDGRQDRNYVCFKAIGGVKKADGTPVFLKSEYDLDFEVVEEEIREQYAGKAEEYSKDQEKFGWWHKLSAADQEAYIERCIRRDILQKRKHKAKLAESGAKARVVRELLGLKSGYTKEELAKPFVMVRIVFEPDYNDPEFKKRIIDAHIASFTGVFGPRTFPTQAPIDIPPEDIQEVHNGEGEPVIDPTEANSEEPTDSDPPESKSQRTDFQNAGRDIKIKTLEIMAKNKSYDLKQLKKPLERFTEKQCMDFYDILDKIPKPGAAAEEEPF